MTKPARAAKGPTDSQADRRFGSVVTAFANDHQVHREHKKGFGSGALKVRDKIFAMMSSHGQFVVKLPKERVDALVASGAGERFDPGHGRLMKEWFVVGTDKNWIGLAKEARQFAGGRRSPRS